MEHNFICKCKTFIAGNLTKQEIFIALKAQNTIKALSPNELHLRFFQKMWNTINELLCNWVYDAFMQGKIPHWLNKTLIYLIPKGNTNETING